MVNFWNDAFCFQFESKFVQFCTLLALNSLRKERHRLEIARDCQKDEREAEDATGNLVRICRLVARLYAHHHQMYLVSEDICSVVLVQKIMISLFTFSQKILIMWWLFFTNAALISVYVDSSEIILKSVDCASHWKLSLKYSRTF